MTSTNEASSPVVSPPLEADAHGKAALLLAESTLHALVEASALTCVEAVAVIQSTADVEREQAATGNKTTDVLSSAGLLDRIQGSFESDLLTPPLP